MVDGEKSKIIAFEYVSKIENVKILELEEKKAIGFETNLEIWQVDTEVSNENSIVPIIIHIVFTSNFPLEFPKLYLSAESFEKTKYIPHVDSKRLVCTYDSEISSTNPDEPAGIVVECIRKAKSIIVDGLSGRNHPDFEDEFKAYWEEKYGKEKYLPKNILSLINIIQPNPNIKLICLKREIRGFKYVLHCSNDTSIRFTSFLKDYGFEFEEVDVFYLKEFPRNIPPFDLKNRDVIEIVNSAGCDTLSRFKSFINNGTYPKLVICNKNFQNQSFLFGWFHKPINTNKKGFRQGALNPFRAFSTFQSGESVNRISTEIFTKERLENRTSGKEFIEDEKTFLIAGVGSIGSNLAYFLNSINTPTFKLIDNDILCIGNIQRHLLGFEHIGSYKTKALKTYLQNNNPLQKTSTKESSIIDVVTSEADYINEADYLFIAIGKANIDNWICHALKEGIINKPVYIIWVEPFLCGGHCIFLHPSEPEFEKFFKEGFFKYNVIDIDEYKSDNNKLSLREAGCQTTYTPYSGANVISFISSIFPVISSIIYNNKTESSVFTWLGNTKELEHQGIKLSDYYKNKDFGTISEHKV